MNDFNDFHMYQQAGHTCGPTCVNMVANFLGVKHKGSDAIINLCGCNATTGTVDTGIRQALEALNLPNMRNPYMGDNDKSFSWLDNMLAKDNVFIMRTLTRGAKHWIIVYGRNADTSEYLIADPWLGMITYDKEQLFNIWSPRNYDGFMVFK